MKWWMKQKNKMDNITNDSISKKLLFFDGLVVGLIVLMIFFISTRPKDNQDNLANAIQAEKAFIDPFKDMVIQAKSAYVYDVTRQKVLFEKNSAQQLPLASITKLMMALTASDMLTKDSKIVIRKEFLQEEGDSGLFANETWRLKDLLDFSLVVSSNDGARSVASVIGALNLRTDDYNLGRKEFISLMNQKALSLGLKNTYFINESGLDIDNFSGGYGTASDVSKLMEYLITSKPDLVEATRYETLSVDSQSKTHKIKNTNTDIEHIPGLIASKTGYTEHAGGNLVVAFDSSISRPIIVVVLGSTQSGRFADINSLVKASLAYVKE